MGSGTVVVDHGAAQPHVAPALEVQAPLAGDKLCNSLQVKGYALQTDRFESVPAVEVLMDGTFYGRLLPGDYSPAAAAAYPGYDSGNAGFEGSYDISKLSAGAHSVTVKAYAADGTAATKTISITKGSTGCAEEVVDPPPAGTPVPADELNALPGASAPIIYRASLSKKGVVSIKVARMLETDTRQCRLTVLVGDTKTSASNEVKSFTVKKDDVTLSAVDFKVKASQLSEFYVDVLKSCDGYSTQLSQDGAKRVRVLTRSGKIADLSGVISGLKKKLKDAAQIRKKRSRKR